MTFELWQILGLLLVGCGVGLVSSLFGVGGGVIIVPFLPLLIPIQPVEVVWISLTCITFIVGINVFAYGLKRIVEWRQVFRLAPVAVLGAFSSTLLSTHIPPLTLRLITGSLLLVLARNMFSPKSLAPAGPVYDRFVFLVSFFGGAASALTGIGAGAFLSPLLLKMRRIPAQAVAPTVNGILFFTASVSLISYLLHRGDEFKAMPNSFWIAAAIIGVASILSSMWGRRVQLGLSDAKRRQLLGGLLVILSIIVFLQVLRGVY